MTDSTFNTDADAEAAETEQQIDGVDELGDFVDTAEQQREELVEQRRELAEVEHALREKADELHREGALNATDHASVEGAINDGEYGAARGILEEAMVTLEWEDDAKERLAITVGDKLDEIERDIEKFRNAVLDLHGEWDDDEIVDLVHGKHPSMPKGTLRTAIDAIGGVSRTGIDDQEMARYLAWKAPSGELTVEEARKIVSYLREVEQ